MLFVCVIIFNTLLRWRTIQFQNLLFVIGAVITGMAQNIAMLCIGRFIVGIASAVSGIADVPYLTEVAPPQYRGILSSQYEMSVSLGVLISFGLDLALSGVDNGWRIAFILPAAFVALQSVGLFWLPESPKWLLEKGYFPEARRTLSGIYGERVISSGSQMSSSLSPGNEEGMADIPASSSSAAFTSKGKDSRNNSKSCSSNGSALPHEVQEYIKKLAEGERLMREQSQSESSVTGPGSHSAAAPATRLVLQQSEVTAAAAEEKRLLLQFRYAVLIIVAVQILAQVTGGNVIRNYAPTIFQNGGISTQMSLVYNVLLGVIKALFTFISILFIDSTGRIKLLLCSIVFVGFGMLFLTIGSGASGSGNISSVETYVVGCAFVYAGFGLGYGPVPWVLSSEMFPTVIRGRIMSISLIASNVAQLVVNFLFLPMVSGITTAGTFACYFFLNVFTLWFTLVFLVETKEITPVEILYRLRARYASSTRRIAAGCDCLCGGVLRLEETVQLNLDSHSSGLDVELSASAGHSDGSGGGDAFGGNVHAKTVKSAMHQDYQ